MAMPMPRRMFVVKGSPNISVPIRIAVIGSNTPGTEALVAPIFRVAMANVAVETMVGKRAKPAKFNQSPPVVIPAEIGASEKDILQKNTIAPTVRE